MPAAITFDFDPTVSPFGLPVRLETLALGAVIFFVLVLIAIRAGRESRGEEAVAGGRSPDGKLRRDDLILMAFGLATIFSATRTVFGTCSPCSAAPSKCRRFRARPRSRFRRARSRERRFA